MNIWEEAFVRFEVRKLIEKTLKIKETVGSGSSADQADTEESQSEVEKTQETC